MSIPVIKYCPGTLAEGFTSYSTAFLRRMFNGRKVGHILPYDAPQKNEEDTEKFLENRKRISISGVQEKMSLILEKNKLRLTQEGEQGTYLLKPVPRDLKKVDQAPANEHVTMQIAAQVYGIHTAENGMIFFKNGTPAYVTKRFDIREDGMKWGKEDFATLAGKSRDAGGPDFKYHYSYEEAAALIRKYVPAWRIEIEKYFLQVLFNYLFSNGDAHLKNFSLLENEEGDYFLSPAYDLLNTRIHVNDSDFALDHGLFADDFESDVYKRNFHRGKEDFIEFGKRIGVSPGRIDSLLVPFVEKQAGVEVLVSRSFLAVANKRGYLHEYNTKLNYLKK